MPAGIKRNRARTGVVAVLVALLIAGVAYLAGTQNPIGRAQVVPGTPVTPTTTSSAPTAPSASPTPTASSTRSSASPTPTPTPTVTPTAMVARPGLHWTTASAKKVRELRFGNDELGYGLGQNGYRLLAAYVDNATDPNTIVELWLDDSGRVALDLVAGDHPEHGIVAVRVFANDGQWYRCPTNNVGMDPIDLIGKYLNKPPRELTDTKLGCSQSGG